MLDLTDIAVFTGMLLLRVGVPALVIVGIGYLLKRLDRRWEAEARAYQAKMASQQPATAKEAPAPQPEAPAPAPRPGKQPATPEQLPFIPPQPPSVEQRPGMYAQPGMAGKRASSPAGKAKCSTPSTPGQPCWQARLKAEGHVPEECVSCDIFQHYPSM